MVTAEFVKQLKQSNVSTDAAKTQERFPQLWKASSSDQQRQIVDLSGMARTSVYSVGKKGSITPKLVLPAAQVLGINPFYITGDTDDEGAFTEDTLKEFLEAKGYSKLAADMKPQKPKRTRTPKVAPVEAAEESSTDTIPATETVEPQETQSIPQSGYDEMSEDEAVMLLKSLFIRAKFDTAGADLLSKVKCHLAM